MFIMSIFSKIKDKITRRLLKHEVCRSLVIYNGRANLIILLQFTEALSYDVIEFMQEAYRVGLRTILSHDSYTTEDNVEEEFAQHPVENKHDDYYILVSGDPKQYMEIFNHLSLSNELLEQISSDIYRYCTTSTFRKLIDDGVLQEHRFTHQNVHPAYDLPSEIYNRALNGSLRFDDVVKIKSKLPRCFDMIDLACIINVYIGTKSVIDYSIIIKSDELVCKALAKIRGGMDNDIDVLRVKVLMDALYCNFIPNPTFELLSVFELPIYLREDIDEEDKLNTDLNPTEIDDLFKEQYERFTIPTMDQMDRYEPIEEQDPSSEMVEEVVD